MIKMKYELLSAHQLQGLKYYLINR